MTLKNIAPVYQGLRQKYVLDRKMKIIKTTSRLKIELGI